jgi:RNA polymerase sigma-70 factor (ECF subfamily)
MQLPVERPIDVASSSDSPAESLPDGEIVRRVIAGETGLFEMILRRYNQRLFRVARSIIGEDGEAEDIVQEAYVRAFLNLRQFEGRALFATWLTKIAAYEAMARRRNGRRLSLVDPSCSAEFDSMAVPSNHRDASDAASQKELNSVLARAVDALPHDLRVVFTMRMVEQLNTEETAECLELSTANVKTRLHRARTQLRSWIDHQIGEESRQLFMFDGVRCDRIVANVMSRIAAM